jgi:hypothetical protein
LVLLKIETSFVAPIVAASFLFFFFKKIKR